MSKTHLLGKTELKSISRKSTKIQPKTQTKGVCSGTRGILLLGLIIIVETVGRPGTGPFTKSYFPLFRRGGGVRDSDRGTINTSFIQLPDPPGVAGVSSSLVPAKLLTILTLGSFSFRGGRADEGRMPSGPLSRRRSRVIHVRRTGELFRKYCKGLRVWSYYNYFQSTGLFIK